MNSSASQTHIAATAPRAFARLTACEVTQTMQDQHKEGLFLTVYTDPDRPEPEHGILG